ncbi:MAG: M15 family metallopeptidase [Candidatus Latescibacterota bacterium]|nr:M15 family metallopeptidase [Candidatus Latescibacterota bacterium]
MSERLDEARRRTFWTFHMERSAELLTAMQQQPVAESSEPFASMPDTAEDAGVEMRFSDTKIAGNIDRIFFIRESLIPDLLAIGRDMNERGWILKIEDGYRTREMQTQLGRKPAVFDMIVKSCQWECGEPPSLDLLHRRSTCLVANYPNHGTHTMGAAVDISVFRRDDGTEVFRGKPYLEMSEFTPMDSPFVSEQEQQNRADITGAMEKHGFLHYPGEFWHYNKGDALYHMMTNSGQAAPFGPVHWDPASNTVTPYNDVSSPLTPPELMAQLLDEALARLCGQPEVAPP